MTRDALRRGGVDPCMVIVALTCVAAGCSRELDTSYGDVRSPSINGISAFVQLLRDAGHPTIARQTLPVAPSGRYGAVIVFESQFGPLPDSMADELEELLARPGPITLVVAPRDGDCCLEYFRSLAGREALDPAIRAEASRRQEVVETRLREKTIETRPGPAPGAAALEPCTRDADGDSGIEVEITERGPAAAQRVRARWPLQRRLVPGDGARVLWRSGADPLLVERHRDDPAGDAVEVSSAEPASAADRVFDLASAMPLLNGGLVDRGNRLLAEDLVARLPSAARVLVVGSSWVVTDEAADDEEPSMLRLLSIPPLPWVAAQVLALLGLFCWWRAPIFGRARRTPPGHAQQFGHHVDALGSLLSRCRRGANTSDGTQVARARLEEWKRLSASPAAARVGPTKPGRGKKRWIP